MAGGQAFCIAIRQAREAAAGIKVRRLQDLHRALHASEAGRLATGG